MHNAETPTEELNFLNHEIIRKVIENPALDLGLDADFQEAIGAEGLDWSAWKCVEDFPFHDQETMKQIGLRQIDCPVCHCAKGYGCEGDGPTCALSEPGRAGMCAIWIAASAVLWMLASVYSLIALVPVNTRIKSWKNSPPPSDWKTYRRRWDMHHRRRTTLLT